MADNQILFRVCTIPESRAKVLIQKDDLDLADLSPKERSLLECSVPFLRTERFQALDRKEKTLILTKLIVRAAFRSVPFAAYSGVALGKIGKRTEAESFSGPEELKLACRETTQAFGLNPTLTKKKYCFTLIARDENTQRRIKHHSGLQQLHAGKLKPEEISEAGKSKLLDLEVLQPLSEPIRYERVELESEIDDPSRVALFYPGFQPVLEEKTADKIRNAAEFVMEAETQRNWRRACAFTPEAKFGFITRYGRNEVSFLDLRENQPELFSALAEMQATRKPNDTFFEKAIREIGMERSLENAHEIRLTGSDTDRLFPKKFWKPTFITAAASLVSANGEEVPYLRSVAGSSLVRHYARYCGFQEIRKQAADLAALEQEYFREAVVAEVFISSAQDGFDSVMPFLGHHRYAIPLTPLRQISGVQQIPLSDLTVSHWNEGIRLRSKKLNREVIPVFTHLGNPASDSNAIFRFLAKVAFQSAPLWSEWTWESLQRSHPRLSYKGVIVAPRIIRATAHEVRSIEKSAGAVRKFLKKIGAPAQFHLLKRATPHYFNQDSEASMRQLLGHLDGEWIIAEYLPPVLGRNHEFIISIAPEKPWKSRINDSLLNKNISAAAAEGLEFHNPGSEWVYLKVFMKISEMDGFMREVVSPWMKRQRKSRRAESWFYLKYQMPEPHLRIRVKGKDTESLRKSLCREIGKDPSLKFELGYYEPEFVRYGGKKSLTVIEEIFDSDSEFVMSALKEIPTLNLDSYCLIAVFRALQFHSKLFPKGAKAEEPLLYRTHNHVFSKQERETAQRIRRLFLSDGADSDAKALLDSIQNECSSREERTFKKLRVLIAAGKCSVDESSLFHSFIHMNIFRLDPEFSKNHEILVLDIVFSILRARFDA